MALLVASFPFFPESVIQERRRTKNANCRRQNYPIGNDIRIVDLKHQPQLVGDISPVKSWIAMVDRMISLIMNEQSHDVIDGVDRTIEWIFFGRSVGQPCKVAAANVSDEKRQRIKVEHVFASEEE